MERASNRCSRCAGPAALLLLLIFGVSGSGGAAQLGRWEISDVDSSWWVECVWLGAALELPDHEGAPRESQFHKNRNVPLSLFSPFSTSYMSEYPVKSPVFFAGLKSGDQQSRNVSEDYPGGIADK